MAASKRCKARRLKSRLTMARGPPLFSSIRARQPLKHSESTTPAAALLVFAATAGMKRVPKIARIGGVHPKSCFFDILHRPQIHLVAKDVAERDKSVQLVQKFGGLHFTDSFHQKFPVNWRARKTHRLQERDLASTQINLAAHD